MRSTRTGSPSTAVNMPQLPANLNVSSPFVREWLSKRREQIRPWADFFKTANFEMPKTPARLSKRVVKNLEHFQGCERSF